MYSSGTGRQDHVKRGTDSFSDATWRTVVVTKRHSSWACIGNPKLEQETIECTHAQETPACQRRPTTLHEGRGSKPAEQLLVWLGWVRVVFLLSSILRSQSFLVVLLMLMLSIHKCPTVEYTVRLVVGVPRFPATSLLLGCCGPCVGPWCLRFCALLSGRCAVRVQSIAKSAGQDFRHGVVVPFRWLRI